MRPFRFRLDALLRLRGYQTRRLGEAWSLARGRAEAAELAVRECEGALARCGADLEQQLAAGLSTASLRARTDASEGLARGLDDLRAEARAAHERAMGLRARWLDARAAERALERLRERRARAHDRVEDRRAQAELEDLWQSAAGRAGRAT